MVATQQLVKEIVDSKKSAPNCKVRRGAKNSETAAKVALMKLKLHAAGDKSLPQTERVYFQVYLPKGQKEKSKPMFFCKKWSIGKVVDYAASLANLKNDNNKAAAKVGLLWRNLFSPTARPGLAVCIYCMGKCQRGCLKEYCHGKHFVFFKTHPLIGLLQ
ncbi:hypothetical protein XENTR_v10017064 [Xenopus tropicalis]|nr:hypothetical protein XENTR_v10017064 [Xenopus tropicalis]